MTYEMTRTDCLLQQRANSSDKSGFGHTVNDSIDKKKKKQKKNDNVIHSQFLYKKNGHLA